MMKFGNMKSLYILLGMICIPALADPDSSEEAASPGWIQGMGLDAYLKDTGLHSGIGPGQEVHTRFGLFGDFSYRSSLDGGDGEFSLGQVVIHGLAEFNPSMSVFAETSLNNDPSWEARVERFQVFWEPSDFFKLSGGRFHLPVTWWNSTYHHGLWLQTSATRPLIIGFDNSFIPNHALGIVAEGIIPSLQAYGVRYLIGVSGGDDDSHQHTPIATAATASESGEDGHDHDHEALHEDGVEAESHDHKIRPMAGLILRPPRVPLLQLGSVIYTEEHAWGEYDQVESMSIGSHIAYTGEQPEFIAEYVYLNHDVHTKGTSSSWGGYVQFGWRLGTDGWASRIKPYTRYDRIDLDEDDMLLAQRESVEQVLGGVRFDLNHHAALKIELCHKEQDDGVEEEMFVIQTEVAW